MPLAVAMVLVMNSLGVSRIELMLRDMTSPVVLVHFFSRGPFRCCQQQYMAAGAAPVPPCEGSQNQSGEIERIFGPGSQEIYTYNCILRYT